MTTNRTMLHWRCSWNTINHQDADAGLFQIFRKGAFLTKEFSGYDANGNVPGQPLSQQPLAAKPIVPPGVPASLQWFETPLWTNGSQWMLGENAGDPLSYASGGANFVFTYGDLTPLYNRPSPYTPANAAIDIQHASRSVLWLKPDHIVIYDRAVSHTAGLFKRFNLCLPAAPSVNTLSGGGSFLTETLSSGQKLFISSLLPTNGTVSASSLPGPSPPWPKATLATTVSSSKTPTTPPASASSTCCKAPIPVVTVDATTYCQKHHGGNPFERRNRPRRGRSISPSTY